MAGPSELDQLMSAVERLGNYDFKSVSDKQNAMLAMRKASDNLQHPYDKILEMWGGVCRQPPTHHQANASHDD